MKVAGRLGRRWHGALALLLLVGLPSDAAAQSARALFDRANAAYAAQAYGQACDDYAALLGRGYDSAWLYYNLGNAYLRDKQLGRAIASYLRSSSRMPRDSDVRANLEFARAQTTDAVPPPEAGALTRLLLVWHYALNYYELVFVTAIVNGLFWLATGLALVYREHAAWRSVSLVLGMMLLMVGSSLAIRRLAPSTVMVVTADEIEVHSGTSYDTMVRYRLHAGTEGEVVDSEQNWLRIRLADGKQGWVAAGDVETVNLR